MEEEKVRKKERYKRANINDKYAFKKKKKKIDKQTKSQYQCLNNTAEHALKVKHNIGKKNYPYSWHSCSFGRTFQGADLM